MPTEIPVNSNCVNMLFIVNAFYDANDAAQIEDSLEFFTNDATIDTWATGAAGYKMPRNIMKVRKRFAIFWAFQVCAIQ